MQATKDKKRFYEVITDGEWAGWTKRWGEDPFEDLAGPFYTRRNASGVHVCAFRIYEKHLNAARTVHGGCLVTLADLSLFTIAREEIGEAASVTLTLSNEFLGPARLGELVEASGDVVRAGRSLIFVRGLLTAEGRPVLNYSGILKKFGSRCPQ